MSAESIADKYYRDGFFVLQNAIPEDLLASYEQKWRSEVGEVRDDQGLLPGWNKWNSYLEHEEIRDILCHSSIFSIFEDLDRGLALHSSRTYGTSTHMGWHHDSTMDNDIAADNYVGVWVALEDVTEDSGPFELIVGSHKWDLDFGKLYSVEGEYAGSFAAYDYLEDEISRRGGEIFSFIAKRGDILVWHGRLVHRGSVAKDRKATRMSLIGHYCNNYAHASIRTAPAGVDAVYTEMERDRMRYAKWRSGGYYFR